ncbi:hypothetical protein BDY24DRAFT_400943 [Mrakia frigida]|uniref:uncharacterized protein n=1 Tax=Mrakia frigida TaxID=29902 RepID=UPI003FCBEF48
MAKASSKKSVPAPAPPKAAGTHKTFTDEDLDALDFDDMDGGSFHSSDEDMRGEGSSGSEDDDDGSEEDDESDEDGAPEEETLAEGRQGAEERRREAERVAEEAKQARRLASTKRALASSQSKAAAAPPSNRKPRTPKASTSTAASAASSSSTGGPSYLPDELFESAAADREMRLAKELEEAKEKAEGVKSGEEKKRKRYERDDRLDIGSTSIRHLPSTSSLAPHLLAPAPTPRRVKKFLKTSQQIKTAAQAQSEQGKSKLAITASSGGRGWVRKEAHLTISQKKKGPSVGFVTGRLV